MAESTSDPDWDDTALLTSWNDAYAEYQKYHSLASLGQKVSPSSPQENDKHLEPSATVNISDVDNAAHVPLNFVDHEGVHTSTASAATAPGNLREKGGAAGKFPATPAALRGGGGGGVAAGLSVPKEVFSGCGIGGGQEVHMKNLMMSWYYAGYYTGLLEGQQMAWGAMQEGDGDGDGGDGDADANGDGDGDGDKAK